MDLLPNEKPANAGGFPKNHNSILTISNKRSQAKGLQHLSIYIEKIVENSRIKSLDNNKEWQDDK